MNIGFLVFTLSLGLASCTTVETSAKETTSVAEASVAPSKIGLVDHAKWDALLKKHVNDKGMVNYKGMIKDSLQLNAYLKQVESNPPDKSTWSKPEQLAYWINAYNAFTVRLIIRNYPVKSIKDIAGGIPFVNTPWDIKFIKIGGETHDLNNIEHGIVRKEFNEPRIHFVLVCAAVSCPRLRNEAYNAKRLEEQLDDQARVTFNDPSKNKVEKDKAQITKLLDWYWGDFKGLKMTRQEYVNQYSLVKMNANAEITFMDYFWELNEQK